MIPIFFKLAHHGWTYKGSLDRKYSVLCGDSSTGKTSFYNLLFRENGQSKCPSIRLFSLSDCVDGEYEKDRHKNQIIFVDEGGCKTIVAKKLEGYLNRANTHFLFLEREDLPTVKISYKAFYEWHRSGKICTLKQYYDDYSKITNPLEPPFICEGEYAHAEHSYYRSRLGLVDAAGGKEKIAPICKGKTVLADGADFGRPIHKVITRGPKALFLPEYFEEVVCRGINPAHPYVVNPLRYCTLQTNSLETFYAKVVNEVIAEKGFTYSKSKCPNKIKELDLLKVFESEA